jgi:type I restriction enzyme S subunit
MSNKTVENQAPELRFPDFRNVPGWSSIELKKCSTPIIERMGEKSLISISISAGIGFVPQAEKFGRDISGNQYSLYTHVKRGDFVYNKGNSLKYPQGCVYQLKEWDEVAAPNVFICFRLMPEYSSQFYGYCFEKNIHGLQLRKHITSGARSNGLLNISKETFFSIELPLPALSEQQKIADCLSSIDDLIAAQTKKIQALKVYKKGLMQQLFPAEGETMPELRFLNFRGAPEWEIQKISKLLKKISSSVNVNLNDMYRQIGIRSHGKGIFHKETVSGKQLGNKRVFWVEENVFIVNIVFAWEQAVAKTSEAENGMIASHRFPMYKAKNNKLSIKYITHFFLTKKGKTLLGLASPGGAGRNRTLGQKDFENLEFLLPETVEEQIKIADCLSSLDNLIAVHTQKLDALKAFKKSLMQKLFPSTMEAEP